MIMLMENFPDYKHNPYGLEVTFYGCYSYQCKTLLNIFLLLITTTTIKHL